MSRSNIEQINFDKRVLSGVQRFEPVSAGYLARVLNVPHRPAVVKKNKSFDQKYVLTNDLILKSKQEKESDIEESFKRLTEKGKIAQSVPGYPKRYSVRINSFSKMRVSPKKTFDDDRFELETQEYEGVDPSVAKSLTDGFKEQLVG